MASNLAAVNKANPNFMDMQGNRADPKARYGIGTAKQTLTKHDPNSGQKINIPIGLLGGGGKNVQYAEADYGRQMALMDKILSLIHI